MSSQTVFITKATTNVTVYVDLLQDNSGTNPGDPLTGLAYNSTGLVCYYVRPLGSATALSLATQTVTGAHSDGGFVEVDSTNMPGKYRLDLSDAICATGVDSATITLAGYADLAAHTIHVVLTSLDMYDSVRGGMTSLPNAAADAAGGLPISDAGGLDLDTLLGYLTAAVATATELAKVPKSDGTSTWNTTALAGIQSKANDALVAFFTSAAALVDLIMDEPLTSGTHNVLHSLGRRIRTINEYGGYEGGAVWINTINGTAGTEDYENGTVVFPCDTIANANTVATSIGLSKFFVLPGSSITFAATQATQIFMGSEYSVALGGQDISDTEISGASISGTATATGSPKFTNCTVGTSNLPTSILENCLINGTITLGEAGAYNFINSHGEGLTGGVIDMGAAIGNSTLTFCNWSGVLELQNMGATGTDVVGIGGCGIITINANCTGGTLYLIGNFSVTDNSGGAVTIIYADHQEDWKDGGRLDLIIDELTTQGDTNETALTDLQTQIGTAGAGLTDLGGMSTAMKAEVLAEAIKVLTTQMTESYAANGVAPTLAQAQYAIHQMLMEFAIAGTSITVKKLDSSTTAFTVTLDDATSPTSATR